MLWNRVQRLPPRTLERIKLMYGGDYLLVVRSSLANYIESEAWIELNANSAEHQKFAAMKLSSLIQEIEKKCISEPNSVESIELFIAKESLSNVANPCLVVNMLYRNLQEEMSAVINDMANLADITVTSPAVNENFQLLAVRFRDAQKFVDIVKSGSKSLNILQKNLDDRQQYLLHSMVDGCANPIRSDLQKMLAVINDAKRAISRLVSNWIANAQQTVVAMKAHEDYLLREITNWKRNQQLAANGHNVNDNFVSIKDWCATLTKLMINNMVQFEEMSVTCGQLPQIDCRLSVQESLKKRIVESLIQFVNNTLVIKQHPSQVLRTKKAVRADDGEDIDNSREHKNNVQVILLASPILQFLMKAPEVKASLLNEKQCREWERNRIGVNTTKSGTLTNSSASINLGSATATFEKLNLDRVKRAERKPTDVVVCEEKFALLFQCEFEVENMKFLATCLSMPVVVTKHSGQDPKAWATVLWDNEFAQIVSAMLQNFIGSKFKKGLSEEDLRYLKRRLFAMEESEIVTWKMFAKDQARVKNYSFFDWFFLIYKLINEKHMKQLWEDNLILGFVERENIHELLRDKPKGTFFIRFGESAVRSYSIAFVDENDEIKAAQCLDDDVKDLKLANEILYLPQFVYLYPNIRKEDVFEKHRDTGKETSPSNTSNPYNCKLVARAQIVQNGPQFGSSMCSPNSMSISTNSSSAASPLTEEYDDDGDLMPVFSDELMDELNECLGMTSITSFYENAVLSNSTS